MPLSLVLLVACRDPAPQAALPEGADAEQGAVLAALGGCVECHTAEGGAPLAGGRALATPFGTFYSTNLSPDPEHGLGAWTWAQFCHAVKEGRGKDGEHLFPVFPYTAFRNMTDQDLAHIWAWLQAQPAQAGTNREPEVSFPYDQRWGVALWKRMAWADDRLPEVQGADPAWLRGRYLGEAVAHCRECHSPRDARGIVIAERAFSGTVGPPEKAPNITPHEHGLAAWSADDLSTYLQMGMDPEGDFAGKGMARVTDATARLSREDRDALVSWVMSLPAAASDPPPEPAKAEDKEPWE